jgi:eukaryotic-like serine/threonine-protein kinase
MQSPPGSSRIDALTGQRLGPYELGEIIGRGGMAVVYRAFESGLNRHVAVKVLPPAFLHDEEFRQRFEAEARTAAQLDHPHIVPIYQFGQHGDIPYLAMPLITGGTFAHLLERGISLELGIQILRQVLDAVDYAHRRESPVVHRDIKPSNILMRRDDYALLADFGIAKIIEPSARATPGTLAGTAEYMAPEQSQGGLITPRADVYAIGAVLYQVLTGRVPFIGPTPWAIIEQHVHAPVPSVRVYKPELAPGWDTLIQHCLAKQPQDRYPSARALDQALQETWEQVQLAHTDVVPYVSTPPSQLYDSAHRAQSLGNWPRVIALCGQILEARPGDAQAVALLQTAQQALEEERRGHEIARLLEQAEVALGAERFTEARRLYQAALEREPDLSAAKA